MKKLQLTALVLVLSGLLGIISAQKAGKKPGSAYAHQARFSVYDYNTKAPIRNAVVVNEKGSELGFTNPQGDLALNLPPNTSDYYTIRAEGYNPFSIRLTQAEKRTGDYEVFLPEASHAMMESIGHVAEGVPTPEEPKAELVKVYIKEDPATYKKHNEAPTVLDFSVQVAASSKFISETSARHDWEGLGPVYVQNENGMYKVRIGPYESQNEAKQVLQEVKSKGRKDAFIVVHQGEFNDKQVLRKPMETKINESPISETVSTEKTTSTQGDYKVRIASYMHPGDFNTAGIDHLGTLESYRKGEWTIMMLGGFTTQEAATKAKNIVISKGFTDAAVIMVIDGILETIQ